jgi:hypothetical protein
VNVENCTLGKDQLRMIQIAGMGLLAYFSEQKKGLGLRGHHSV